DVGRGVQVVGGRNGRPGLRVGIVGKPGAVARAFLDEYLETGLFQLLDGLGNQGDAPFSRRALLNDSHLHGHDSLTCAHPRALGTPALSSSPGPATPSSTGARRSAHAP